MPCPVGMPIGPHVHGVGVIAPFGWNWAMPRDVAVHVSQRDAFSPRLPCQCQPLPGVNQAIQPRVETVVGWTVVKSGSARKACAAPLVVHCRWPSVQKPAGATVALPAVRLNDSRDVPPWRTTAVAATVFAFARRPAILRETVMRAVARLPAQR